MKEKFKFSSSKYAKSQLCLPKCIKFCGTVIMCPAMNGCGLSFTHLLWLKCGLLQAQLVNTEIKGLVIV